jgi:hypothetical protein
MTKTTTAFWNVRWRAGPAAASPWCTRRISTARLPRPDAAPADEAGYTEALSLRQKLALLLAAAVFLAAGLAVALTRIPWCDEAWFACAGYHLAAHGRLVTPVIEAAPNDPKTIGQAQHTYWVMPLDLLFQAGCYKLFGFSLLTVRAGSILWGLVAL